MAAKKPAPTTIGKIEPTPPELTAAIQERRSAVFVGAGLSMGSGYPNWSGLLTQLIDLGVARRDISASQSTELKALIATNDSSNFLMVAQEASDRLGRSRFIDEIVKVFSDKSKLPTPTHMELTKIPFDLAVTTNYDKLVEQAYAKPGELPRVYTHANAPDFADALWRKLFFILKAHGDVEKRSEIVITELDYREIIFRSRGYQSALAAIFTTRTVLFVGVSLSDPETKLLLSYLHDAFHGGGADHFALVPRSQFSDTTVSRWRKDYRVSCILYEPSSNSHPEILAFLKSLPH